MSADLLHHYRGPVEVPARYQVQRRPITAAELVRLREAQRVGEAAYPPRSHR